VVSDAAAPELSLALLFIDIHRGSPEVVAVRLADALVAILPAHSRRRAGSGRLAALLTEELRKRDVRREHARRLAGDLVIVFGVAADAGEFARAMALVRETLARAGLGTPEIVLIETEITRFLHGESPRR
jgi:hypothetical protein